ncbi:MAG: hypothetical protein SVX38_11940 [Chloroflexota bacterium]|nr:hypothetical protein [Chloroflexota bacterium]
MNKQRPVAEIILLVVGAVLSCCWLPRGITGLFYIVRTIVPRLPVSGEVLQFLQSASNPLAWYNQLIVHRFYVRGNFKVGQILNAIPLCLYPLVGIAILVVAIVLYTRSRGSGGEESV